MKFVIRLLIVLPLSAYAATVAAHPFHDHGGGLAAGLAHPFLGLDHLLAMVTVGLWAAQTGGRALWATPLSFLAAMLAGGLLALSGFALPGVEPLIAASLLVLGLAVCFGWKAPLPAGASLVAFFAVFHGYAHGAELPATGSVALYAAGFMAATAALHLVGISIGAMLGSRAMPLRIAGAFIAGAGGWLLVPGAGVLL